MGDQRAAQHFLGLVSRFGHRFGQAHTARVSCVGFLEFALATATGVDLRLDHPQRAIKFTRGGFGIFCFQNGAAVGNGGTIGAQEFFGLIFMNVHWTVPSVAKVS